MSGATALVDEIRRAIIGGELSPNERLVELDLAQRYSVSRGAVRVALLELVNEGLVDRELHRGARVRVISLAEAIEISEVRMVIEGLCARRAAEKITEDQADELRQLVSLMVERTAEDDLMAYSGLNGELHDRIRQISGHRAAAAIVERLRNQSVRQQFRMSLLPGRANVSVAEHAAIVEAVAAGDGDRAEEQMRAHLANVIATLRRTAAGQGWR
ncbi:MAG: GntR family transcriptional regulator [Acidimicrobiales bacterium]|nr:GntR family transcriptional regulator [Acidimicrobiales bacterium]MBO0886947.1 GntR family transcriptional regulator [Acidimicrobiales bacterium]